MLVVADRSVRRVDELPDCSPLLGVRKRCFHIGCLLDAS
jgi:hypothetical protein